MGRSSGGYTIIEVMIVLVITGVLLAGALLVFHGQQNDTQFSQSMEDIASKIQNYVGQITSGTYPGSEGYSCSIGTPPRPVLSTAAGSNEGCVFLGRAIQVQPTKGTFSSYVILGTRDAYNSGSDSQLPATSVDQAQPEPAISSGNYVLVDNYTLGSSVTVLSSKGIYPGGPALGSEFDLVGVYNVSCTTTNGSGNLVLSLCGYPFNGNAVGQSSALTSCIEESSPCTSASIGVLSQWNLCLGDGAGRTALLEVRPASSGITTSLNYEACS